MLDGVYIARTQEADVSFFDIDRVEVLRGPQGTLYGRNTAGAINVLTNRPKLGATEGALNVGYGNYNAFNADAVLNTPVGDSVAVRAGLSYDRHDSYVKLAQGDGSKIGPQRENLAARLQVFIKPADNVTVLLRGEYAKINGTQSGLLGPGSSVPLTQFFNLSNGTERPTPPPAGMAARLPRWAMPCPISRAPAVTAASWAPTTIPMVSKAR
jgi:iron complex outermembrane receptor protein